MKLKIKKINISLIGLFSIMILSSFIFNNSQVSAQFPTPTPTATAVPLDDSPRVYLWEAYGFTDIGGINKNDYFIIARYELAYDDTPDSGWCQLLYMKDNSGCDLTPPNPEFSFSLLSGRVYAEYLDNSSTIHIQNAKIPRIGHGLIGLYAEAPAGTSFGFNSSLIPGKACLRFNTDYFYDSANDLTEYPTNCRTVQNIAGGSAELATFISGGDGILYNLEDAMSLPRNTLIDSRGKVTPTGVIYLEESLQGIGIIAQNSAGDPVFQLGTSSPNSGFTSTGVQSNFADKVADEAAASGITEHLRIISAEYLGFDSGGFTATIILLILGLFAAGAVFMATRNGFLSFAALSMMMLPGIFIGGVSVAFLFTAISLALVFGSWYWIRRSPE